MSYVVSEHSISKKVLNEDTGELEAKTFKEVRKTSGVRGGFFMAYLAYDEAVEEIISSKLDFTIIVAIRRMFTKNRVEVVISPTNYSKVIGTSKQKVTSLIKLMVEHKLLMRVDRSTYRLNPFMYIPYQADGSTLQREWEQLSGS